MLYVLASCYADAVYFTREHDMPPKTWRYVPTDSHHGLDVLRGAWKPEYVITERACLGRFHGEILHVLNRRAGRQKRLEF